MEVSNRFILRVLNLNLDELLVDEDDLTMI
jgi:hypothetical protein